MLDENLSGALWRVVARHNLAGVHPLDVVRVSDSWEWQDRIEFIPS
jgi:hypothetical protein